MTVGVGDITQGDVRRDMRHMTFDMGHTFSSFYFVYALLFTHIERFIVSHTRVVDKPAHCA